jgi:hypothetical protein
MPSSPNRRPRVVTDNIHGDIILTDDEWWVVNTATFQRLRSLKQLGMGHLVYPNATHTRFAHSLGVFRIMCRVLEKLDQEKLDTEARVDWVKFTEEEVEKSSTTQVISGAVEQYPDHETLGRHILESQSDIRTVLGEMIEQRELGRSFPDSKGPSNN